MLLVQVSIKGKYVISHEKQLVLCWIFFVKPGVCCYASYSFVVFLQSSKLCNFMKGTWFSEMI